MHKKYGSRDRKHINNLCYTYYRTGTALKQYGIEHKIKASIYLCNTQPSIYLEDSAEQYNKTIQLPITEKMALVGLANATYFFPNHQLLSNTISKEDFLLNQLAQPHLFLRIRPKYLSRILLELPNIPIDVKLIDPYTLQLANTTNAALHFLINKEVVIQDYASQMVFDVLLTHLPKRSHIKVWDCCAASGGKSILLTDRYQGSIDLFVTDVRETILEHLQTRFTEANIKNYKMATLNVAKKVLDTKDKFDLVIVDAPCTGSGTWGRTPERKLYFSIKDAEQYVTLQKSITQNAWNNVQEGGILIYITCSVLAMENEAIVAHIAALSNATLLTAYSINGSKYNSDYMYVAIAQKKMITIQ